MGAVPSKAAIAALERNGCPVIAAPGAEPAVRCGLPPASWLMREVGRRAREDATGAAPEFSAPRLNPLPPDLWTSHFPGPSTLTLQPGRETKLT